MVDSSVWIDFFNGADNWQTVFLKEGLGFHRFLIADLILAEVLSGFQNQRDFDLASSHLRTLPFIELGGFDNALSVANVYRLMRKSGVTIRKTIDVFIACGCTKNGLTLLHRDRDFDNIERFTALKTVKNLSPGV